MQGPSKARKGVRFQESGLHRRQRAASDFRPADNPYQNRTLVRSQDSRLSGIFVQEGEVGVFGYARVRGHARLVDNEWISGEMMMAG